MKKLIKVLIVEDSQTQAEGLKYLLGNHNYQVMHALTGEMALEVVESFMPDVIISDILMPGMDGYSFCDKIKSDDRMKQIPVILLTSLSDMRDVMKGLESGADSFIIKPYTEEYLISRIQYFLQNAAYRNSKAESVGLEIFFANRKYLIHSSPQRILDLLVSSYENAVIKNQELVISNKNLHDEIRERRVIEKELVNNKQDLETANLEKTELIGNQDQLMSIIAHDLRGNFNPLLGITELMMNPDNQMGPEEIAKLAMRLNDSFHRQYQLLENLLSWGNIKNRNIQFMPVPVRLQAAVNGTVGMMEENLRRKELTVEVEIDPHLSVLGDKTLIETLLRNLISNAVKFSFSGKAIRIRAHKKDVLVQVDVRDEGVGMAASKVSNLFKTTNFSTTHGTENERGSGLGLNLCHALVTKQGGTIWVESEPGKGATFSFTIPLFQS